MKDFEYYLKIRKAATRHRLAFGRQRVVKNVLKILEQGSANIEITLLPADLEALMMYERFHGIEDWISGELLPNLKREKKERGLDEAIARG